MEKRITYFLENGKNFRRFETFNGKSDEEITEEITLRIADSGFQTDEYGVIIKNSFIAYFKIDNVG